MRLNFSELLLYLILFYVLVLYACILYMQQLMHQCKTYFMLCLRDSANCKNNCLALGKIALTFDMKKIAKQLLKVMVTMYRKKVIVIINHKK